MIVSSSCSTSGRGRVTLVMESNSCSTSDRGRVTLVMVSSSCSTSGRGRVTLVMGAKLPANNLRRISTIYIRGYLQGSENGRVVTIEGICSMFEQIIHEAVYEKCKLFLARLYKYNIFC